VSAIVVDTPLWGTGGQRNNRMIFMQDIVAPELPMKSSILL
jgi:hypothetical protein